MKITFFSNFLNHHQLPFCKEMIKIIGNNFKFVATEKIPQERLELGYEDMNKKYDFVIRAYENDDMAYKLALESDIVIIGSAPNKYIKKRLKENKIIFRYSERVFKNGFKLKSFLSILLKRTFTERKNTFLLCSSAYAARDYNLAGAYLNKTYKWGYFPEVKEYENIDKVLENKNKNSILWVGRFLDWKHPEIVIELANKLKEQNIDFNIKMIGTGEQENQIIELVKKYNLENKVELLGSMPPEIVRKHMEESQVLLFTSDKGEGWGAVLNEAMNSGCAVIASNEIGSVPFLIDNNKNGLIYKSGNIDDLYTKTLMLLNDNDKCKYLGKNAYETMIDLWSPSIAAKRFIELAKHLQKNDNCKVYKDGPCSKAERLKDNWYIARK